MMCKTPNPVYQISNQDNQVRPDLKSILTKMELFCPYCKQTFVHKEMMEHERQCPEINYKCINDCGKNSGLKTEQEYLDHLEECFKYRCKYCDQRLTQDGFEQHSQQNCSQEAAN